MDRKKLSRWATWTGIASLAMPVIWVVVMLALEQMGNPNAALGFGWLTVLPMLLAVPVGLAATLILIILALATPAKPDA